MFRFTPLLYCLPFALLSCSGSDNDNGDLTTAVNKNGAVESSLLMTPLNSSYTILTTTHKVWVRDTVYKIIQYHDTLPALGTEMATAENKDGETQTVPVKKEYEIYITVK